MNLTDVRIRLDNIKALGENDPEGAHIELDALYRDVLEAIATRKTGPDARLARLALEAEDYDFPMWYA